MNSLRRLTALGIGAMALIVLPAVAVVYFFAGAANAGAFAYGVGIGVVVFTAIALTVSLMTGPTTGTRMLFGGLVYVGRLGFAALAIGVPVALAGWPVVWIICGFAVVYAVENVTVLAVLGMTKSPVSELQGEDAKRRVEA